MTESQLLPVLSSLIAGELAQMRHVSALDPMFLGLRSDTAIGSGALGTDSLDLLTLASAVDEMFHLHETGVEEYLLRYRTIENWCEVVAVSLKKKAERVTFRTSGSTGTPKRCVHLWQHLEQEAREHAEQFHQCGRVLSMIPSHHIYGFIWTALLPGQLGIPTVDVRRWSPSRIAHELRPGDLLVGVPANWQLLSRVFDVLPQGVLGVTSGAACPPDLFHRVAAAGIDFVEVYGSSETAGVGRRLEASAPFKLLPHWKRAGQDMLARTNGVGSGADYVEAPDRLLWEDDWTFRVGARQDGAVQIAGRNVFPQHVAEVIRTYPAVQACAVRAMRPEEGNRLKAFVVWRPEFSEAPCSEASLKHWLDMRLQHHEQPLSFTFGAALPLNAMHKDADWVMA